MTLLAGSGESKEQRLFPAQVWVIPLMMWPEFVLIFGIPVTLLSNTEPTFKKDTLTLFHKHVIPHSLSSGTQVQGFIFILVMFQSEEASWR